MPDVEMSAEKLVVKNATTAPKFLVDGVGDLVVSAGGVQFRKKGDEYYYKLSWPQIEKLFVERGDKGPLG